MKKTLLLAAALVAGTSAFAETESYVAITADGPAAEFANAVIGESSSTVTFGTANMEVTAVAGTTPKDVVETESGVFPGWSEWNSVEWKNGNRNLNDAKTRYFYYIQGTGNPYTAISSEAVMTDGVATGTWRASYTYYLPDGSNGMPISGLYYKFAPKQDGTLKIQVWSNKGNRNTYVVDGETMQAVSYEVEGYINGQTEQESAVSPFTGVDTLMNCMRYLSNDDIKALHDAAKTASAEDGTTYDSAPWVIGAGNQPFFGWVIIEVKAGKTYWLLQDSSQIGFGGYDFTPAGDEEQGGEEDEPAVSYNYHSIVPTETKSSGELDGVTLTDEDGCFSATFTDKEPKLTVDANNANFGTQEEYEKFTMRFKYSGKSQSTCFITLNIPQAGKLQVMARSGSSSATNRDFIITQNDQVLLDQIVQDSDAVKFEKTNSDGSTSNVTVYPVYECSVEAGTATVTFPVGSVNFYCFRLGIAAAGIDAVVAEPAQNTAIYNLRGQRVSTMQAGQVYIVGGKKVIF